MNRRQPAEDITLPSFTIVIETENLSVTEIDGLEESLDSLATQTPSPAQANEVLIIESGDTPTEVLDHIKAKYPWVRVVFADADIDYYDAKMEGARLGTGDVVIYADSDCVYDAGWIRAMIAPFAQYEDIDILGGETAIRGNGPYAQANAISFFFDGHTYGEELYTSPIYYFNNAAFRRQFLLDNPVQHDLPLYRGHCVVHTHELLEKGVTIWRQPHARAHHAPPEGLFNFYWRYLLTGRDNAVIRTLLPDAKYRPAASGRGSKWQKLKRRLRANISANPIRILCLPISLPIAAFALALVWRGDRISRNKPDYLLERFNTLEAAHA